MLCFNRCETSRDAINPDLTYLFDIKGNIKTDWQGLNWLKKNLQALITLLSVRIDYIVNERAI